MEESFNTTTDLNGNIIITGDYSSGSLTFGTTTINSVGGGDIFIAKYDSAGNALWAHNVGGNGGEWISSVATDDSGNVYLAGTFGSASLTIGTTTLSNAGFNDVFIVKYDSNGNVIWARRGGGSNEERVYSIAVDASGNSYITGLFNSLSATFGSYTIVNSNSGSTDIYVVKLDRNGNFTWAKQAGGSSFDHSYSLAVDKSSNIYVTGDFQSPSITFGSFTLSNTSGNPIFLVKYDSTGNVIWAKSFAGGFNYSVQHNSLSAVNSNDIYMTGNFYSASAVFGTYTLTNSNSSTADFLIAKFDTAGTVLWAKRAGGITDEWGYGVARHPSGDIFITGGFTTSAITFGTSTLIPQNGATDPMFIVQYDSVGNEICAAGFPSGGDDQNAIAIDTSGSLYVFGDYLMNPFILGNDTLPLAGGEDIFLAKFISCNLITLSDEHIGSNAFLLYPNPTNQNATLKFDNSEGENCTLSLFNLQGQLVRTISNITSDKVEIERQNLLSGLYFIQLRSDTQIIATGKLKLE